MSKKHNAPESGAKSNYLLREIRGVTIEGICLDPPETLCHEDLIRITTLNDITQIDIAVVVPPIYCYSEIDLQDSLTDLLTNTGRNFKEFIGRTARIFFGLQETDPRNVLVATYILDGNKLVEEDFDSSTGIGHMVDSESCDNVRELKEILHILEKLLFTKPKLKRKIHNSILKNFYTKRNEGFLIPYIATQIFNDTAVAAAKRKNIPFIKRPFRPNLRPFFVMNYEGSIFSRGLRDPCGFINASNFFAHFSKEKLPFPRMKLRRMIRIEKS